MPDDKIISDEQLDAARDRVLKMQRVCAWCEPSVRFGSWQELLAHLEQEHPHV